MRKLFDQALGRQPEPLWMSALGAIAAFLAPIALVACAVAFGWSGQ